MAAAICCRDQKILRVYHWIHTLQKTWRAALPKQWLIGANALPHNANVSIGSLHNVNLTALQCGRASVLRLDPRMRDAVDGRINLDKRPQVDESQDASPNKQSQRARSKRVGSLAAGPDRRVLCLRVRDERYGGSVPRGRGHIPAAKNAGVAVFDRVDPKCFVA